MIIGFDGGFVADADRRCVGVRYGWCVGGVEGKFVVGVGGDLMWEVVGSDGEVELGVVGVAAQVVTAHEPHGGDLALCGKRKDVGGVEEEVFAEVACCAGFLAEMVVADEEECRVGVVVDVAHDPAELVGDVHAAERHEVVDVVDDDEHGLEVCDERLDVAGNGEDVTAHVAEHVEADEMKVVFESGVCLEFVVDACADVWSVECIDPQDSASVVVDVITVVAEDSGGEHFCEVVCAAGLLAGKIGGVVLSQNWLSIDGYECSEVEAGKVGVGCELTVLPGFGFVCGIGITVKIDVHGFCFLVFFRGLL